MRPPLHATDRAELETQSLVPPEAPEVRGYDCDACGQHFTGEPAGSGLFVWSRGEEVRYEEPPLCEECASKVTLGALHAFETEEEEEG
jgi:hypothetical protein